MSFAQSIPEAPVYTATLAEMDDLSNLLARAAHLAQLHGAVRIDPPPNWTHPPLQISPSSRFFVRMQTLPAAPFAAHPSGAHADDPVQPRKRRRPRPPHSSKPLSPELQRNNSHPEHDLSQPRSHPVLELQSVSDRVQPQRHHPLPHNHPNLASNPELPSKPPQIKPPLNPHIPNIPQPVSQTHNAPLQHPVQLAASDRQLHPALCHQRADRAPPSGKRPTPQPNSPDVHVQLARDGHVPRRHISHPQPTHQSQTASHDLPTEHAQARARAAERTRQTHSADELRRRAAQVQPSPPHAAQPLSHHPLPRNPPLPHLHNLNVAQRHVSTPLPISIPKPQPFSRQRHSHSAQAERLNKVDENNASQSTRHRIHPILPTLIPPIPHQTEAVQKSKLAKSSVVQTAAPRPYPPPLINSHPQPKQAWPQEGYQAVHRQNPPAKAIQQREAVADSAHEHGLPEVPVVYQMRQLPPNIAIMDKSRKNQSASQLHTYVPYANGQLHVRPQYKNVQRPRPWPQYVRHATQQNTNEGMSPESRSIEVPDRAKQHRLSAQQSSAQDKTQLQLAADQAGSQHISKRHLVAIPSPSNQLYPTTTPISNARQTQICADIKQRENKFIQHNSANQSGHPLLPPHSANPHHVPVSQSAHPTPLPNQFPRPTHNPPQQNSHSAHDTTLVPQPSHHCVATVPSTAAVAHAAHFSIISPQDDGRLSQQQPQPHSGPSQPSKVSPNVNLAGLAVKSGRAPGVKKYARMASKGAKRNRQTLKQKEGVLKDVVLSDSNKKHSHVVNTPALSAGGNSTSDGRVGIISLLNANTSSLPDEPRPASTIAPDTNSSVRGELPKVDRSVTGKGIVAADGNKPFDPYARSQGRATNIVERKAAMQQFITIDNGAKSAPPSTPLLPPEQSSKRPVSSQQLRVQPPLAPRDGAGDPLRTSAPTEMETEPPPGSEARAGAVTPEIWKQGHEKMALGNDRVPQFVKDAPVSKQVKPFTEVEQTPLKEPSSALDKDVNMAMGEEGIPNTAKLCTLPSIIPRGDKVCSTATPGIAANRSIQSEIELKAIPAEELERKPNEERVPESDVKIQQATPATDTPKASTPIEPVQIDVSISEAIPDQAVVAPEEQTNASQHAAPPSPPHAERHDVEREDGNIESVAASSPPKVKVEDEAKPKRGKPGTKANKPKKVRAPCKRKVNHVAHMTIEQDDVGRLAKAIVFPDSKRPISLSAYKNEALDFHERIRQSLLPDTAATDSCEVKRDVDWTKDIDQLEDVFWSTLKHGHCGKPITVAYGVDVEAEGAYDSAENSYVEWKGWGSVDEKPKKAKVLKKFCRKPPLPKQERKRKEAMTMSNGAAVQSPFPKTEADPSDGKIPLVDQKRKSPEPDDEILEEGRGTKRLGIADKRGRVKPVKQVNSVPCPKSHVGNLNRSGLLRHMPKMPGINHSMYYVGQLFTRFCWHVEDAFLNSVSYLHHGSAEKIWYAVPPKYAEQFAEFASNNVFSPDLLKEHKDSGQLLLMNKTTMFEPRSVRESGIEVFRVVHKPGSFVLTAPRAYHAGFNCGFNIAEAVNYASPSWFPVGRDASRFGRHFFRPLCVPWEYLLFHEARSTRDNFEEKGMSAGGERVMLNARLVARELESIVSAGEAKIRQYAQETNCRIAMLSEIDALVKNNQLGPEFGHGAGMVCSLCGHACHFYAEMCASCEDSFESRCVEHFGIGHDMCNVPGHKTVIVRRHDPVFLLDLIGLLERIGDIQVPAEVKLGRYQSYLRNWQTPYKTSGLRLRMNLKAAMCRIAPQIGGRKAAKQGNFQASEGAPVRRYKPRKRPDGEKRKKNADDRRSGVKRKKVAAMDVVEIVEKDSKTKEGQLRLGAKKKKIPVIDIDVVEKSRKDDDLMIDGSDDYTEIPKVQSSLPGISGDFIEIRKT